MAAAIETGHAVNVNNFEQIITVCLLFGSAYNPSKASIKLPALQQLLAESRDALQEVAQQLSNFNVAVENRRNAFADLKPLSTRLVNALAATDATKGTIDDAKGFNRKIQGTRANKTSDKNADDSKSISSSQQSMMQLIEHFNNLVILLSNESSYQPNEPELQITTLQARVATMRASMSPYMIAADNLNTARINRNEKLYNTETGLHPISLDVKQYVKSVFGATNGNYKKISGIRINKMKK